MVIQALSLLSLSFARIVLGQMGSSHPEDSPVPKLAEVPLEKMISLSDAIEVATKFNAQARAAHFQVEAAAANLSGQRSPLNPTFTYAGLNNTVAPAPTLNINEPSNYGLLFTVETNGANQWRTSQASNQLNQAKQDSASALLNIRQAAEAAYVGLQIANRSLLDERAAYADAKRIRDLTHAQFEAGAAPQTNAIRADIALTQELGNLLNQINSVKAARASLNIALGRSPEIPVDVSEPLQFTSIEFEATQLQREAINRRPEVKSAQFNLKALHSAVGLQRSQYFPNLYVASDLRQVKSGIFEIGLAMPLFDFGGIKGSVRQAEKLAQAQEAQVTLVEQQVRLDVESAFEAFTVAKGTVEAFQNGMVPQAEALEQRVEKGYTLGGNTILDLLDAQGTLRTARIAYYGSIGAYRQALAQLERAVGAPISALNSSSSHAASTEGKRP